MASSGSMIGTLQPSPEEFESIKFDMPTGPEPLLFRETVMIHPSGLLLCGQNKFVRHWLDVFLRDKLPPRVVVNLTHDQEFLLHIATHEQILYGHQAEPV